RISFEAAANSDSSTLSCSIRSEPRRKPTVRSRGSSPSEVAPNSSATSPACFRCFLGSQVYRCKLRRSQSVIHARLGNRRDSLNACSSASDILEFVTLESSAKRWTRTDRRFLRDIRPVAPSATTSVHREDESSMPVLGPLPSIFLILLFQFGHD